MALSLNDIKKRKPIISGEKNDLPKPVKKRIYAPWEEAPNLTKQGGENVDSIGATQATNATVLTSSVHPGKSVTKIAKDFDELEKETQTVILNESGPGYSFENHKSSLGAPVAQDSSEKMEKALVRGLDRSELVLNQSSTVRVKNRKLDLRWQEVSTSSPIAPLTGVTKANGNEVSAPVGATNPFPTLVGLQRKILLFMFQECLKRASDVTGPLGVEYIASTLAVPFKSIKKTIQRLEEKFVINRVEVKNGRGGWTSYRLPREVYVDLLRAHNMKDSGIEGQQSPLKVETNRRQVPELEAESSMEWDIVDHSILSSIGFTKNHVRQIAADKKFTPEQLCDYIKFFEFDLRVNQKNKAIKGDPINYFMGIMRKGIPYIPSSNYISSEMEARQRYIEFKQTELAKLKAAEEEIFDLEFQTWVRSISKEERRTLASYFSEGSEAELQTLKERFRASFYSKK